MFGLSRLSEFSAFVTRRFAHWQTTERPGTNIQPMWLLALLLMVAGGAGPWVQFPLADPVAGTQLGLIQGLSAGFSQGGIYLFLIAFATAAAMAQMRLLVTIAIAAAFITLLYALVYLAMIQPQWLDQYILESQQRVSLQRFFNDFYLANKGGEPGLVMVRQFDGVSQRLLIAWHMLAWGWKGALFGTLLFWLLAHSQKRMFGPGLSVFALTFFGVGLVLAGPARDATLAEYYRQSALANLAAGEPHQAIQAFQQALHHDEYLQRSGPFAEQLSEAYYQHYGPDHAYGWYYLAAQDEDRQLNVAALERLNQLQLNLDANSLSSRLLLLQADQLQSQLFQTMGLMALSESDLTAALNFFDQALRLDSDRLHLELYRAHVYFLGRQPLECSASLRRIIPALDRPSLKANLYSSLGDCLLQAGRTTAARDAYQQSLALDSVRNFRAVKGLSGT